MRRSTTDTEKDGMPLPDFTTVRQTLATRAAAGLGGAIAVVASTVYTIVGAMPAKDLPGTAPGAAIEAGQWRVVARDAAIATRRPDGGPLQGGGHALVVTLDMTNRTQSSSSDFFAVVAIDPPLPGVETKPSFYLARDKAPLSRLHPNLPERILVSWPMKADAALPDRIRLTVTAKSYKQRDNLYGAPGWFNPKAIAAVTLPVAAAP